MDSSESSPLDSFKSKKILQSSLTPTPSDQNPQPHTDPDSDPNAWSSKTPEKKPIIPSRRIRNPGAAISLKEVRQAAKNLQEPGPDLESIPDPLMTSAKQRIPIWPDDSPFKLPEKLVLMKISLFFVCLKFLMKNFVLFFSLVFLDSVLRNVSYKSG